MHYFEGMSTQTIVGLPSAENPFGSIGYQLISAFRYMKQKDHKFENKKYTVSNSAAYFPIFKYIAQMTKLGYNLGDMIEHLFSKEFRRMYVYLRSISTDNCFQMKYNNIVITTLSVIYLYNDNLNHILHLDSIHVLDGYTSIPDMIITIDRITLGSSSSHNNPCMFHSFQTPKRLSARSKDSFLRLAADYYEEYKRIQRNKNKSA